MAVSPLPSQSPAAAATTVSGPGAAKTLAMRNSTGPQNPTGFTGAGAISSKARAPEPELAEQLNADIREKYVKGMFGSVYIYCLSY